MEDTFIVEMFLKRQEEAIRHTADKYGHRLRRIAVGIVEDAQAAEECENDTYLQAWQRIPPSEPYDHFFQFLARIIRHLSIDWCRGRSALKRGGRMVELTEELAQCVPASDDPAAEVDRKMLGAQISRYLQTLPPEKRLIFLRRYWYMDTVADIAQKLGIGESKVKTTLFRCRKELRAWLEKEGYCL